MCLRKIGKRAKDLQTDFYEGDEDPIGVRCAIEVVLGRFWLVFGVWVGFGRTAHDVGRGQAFSQSAVVHFGIDLKDLKRQLN